MPLSAQVEEPLCFFSSCVSIKGGRNWTLEVACSIVSDMCCCDSPHKAEPPCHPSRPSQTSPQHYMGVLDPFLLTANMCSSTVAVLTKDKHLLREKDRKNRQNRNCQRGIGVRKAVDLAMKRNQTTEMSSSRRFCCRRFGVRTNEKRERERERERFGDFIVCGNWRAFLRWGRETRHFSPPDHPESSPVHMTSICGRESGKCVARVDIDKKSLSCVERYCFLVETVREEERERERERERKTHKESKFSG